MAMLNYQSVIVRNDGDGGGHLGQISKMLQHWNETEVEEWYWRNMKHETCWKKWNKGTSRKPGNKNVGNAMREREIETRENATLETMDKRLGWRWKKSHYSGRWGLNGFEDLVRRPWWHCWPVQKMDLTAKIRKTSEGSGFCKFRTVAFGFSISAASGCLPRWTTRSVLVVVQVPWEDGMAQYYRPHLYHPYVPILVWHPVNEHRCGTSTFCRSFSL